MELEARTKESFQALKRQKRGFQPSALYPSQSLLTYLKKSPPTEELSGPVDRVEKLDSTHYQLRNRHKERQLLSSEKHLGLGGVK